METTKNSSPLYIIWLAILGIVVLAGLYTTYQVLKTGHILYSANNIVVWTLPLATYAFFSLTSAGLALIASIPLVFKMQRFESIATRAILLSIAALLAAGVSMLLELGEPWHVVNFLTSPNPMSTLWWLSVLYSIFLILLLVMLWRLRAGKSSRILSILVFALAILIPSTVGATFGLTEARPIYFGEFLPIYFPVTALLSGLAAFMLVSLAYYQISGAGQSGAQTSLLDDLAKILGAAIGINLLFFAWWSVVGLYASAPEYEAFRQLVSSWPYHVQLWLGLVVPLVLMVVPSVRRSIGGKVAACALVLLGVFVGLVVVVESGLVVPIGPFAVEIPTFVIPNHTIWEWLVVAFAFAVMMLLYTLGEKYLKPGTAS
ncbi:MAG: hypothetical protein D6768_15010 [Chloroflexi bacterium]|nr:MAG: hypothetical protein D6768_15010 [Chloroflexota bacterium]